MKSIILSDIKTLIKMRFFESISGIGYLEGIRFLAVLFLVFLFQNLNAQTTPHPAPPVQNLRGEIRDMANHDILAGTTILIKKDSLSFGTSADENGQYIFKDIPIGRYKMEVSFVGFETIIIKEILLESGREYVQDIWLKENTKSLEQIVITAGGRRVESVQKLSAHTITVEETFRFPATFNDPTRLAMSYPGVVAINDGANDISVRGNTPASMQWRLEGAEIVNPNHLANAGTTTDLPSRNGGGVNILSAQMLGTSTLWTGAFPTEYGNALGGIMDMRFRKGNSNEHEFTVKTGLLGLEFAAEGPFSDSTEASFLFNYRYSFVGLVTSLGVDFGDEKINFQDFSFNVNIPTKKIGEFSFFGMGGLSTTEFEAKDSADVEIEKDLLNINFESQMGAVGLTHKMPLGKQYWKSSLVFSGLKNDRKADYASFRDQVWEGREIDSLTHQKISFLTTFARKLKSSQLKFGLSANYENIGFQTWVGSVTINVTRFTPFSGSESNWTFRPFAEWTKQILPSLELKAGGGYSFYTFPDFSYFEPNFQLTYQFNEKQKLSFRASVHSQFFYPELYAYFIPFLGHGNPNLEPIKTAFLVFAYENVLNENTIFKAEFYRQNIIDVPIDREEDRNPTYSSITYSDDREWLFINVESSGIATNIGLDLSLQKFISDDYYFLFSGSLYSSKFEDVSNVTRNTPFNGNYVLNVTAGKEFHKTKKDKSSVFGMNLRSVLAGGRRYTPFEGRKPNINDADPFSAQLRDYFRADLRFYFKRNRPNLTSTLALDIQNVTNRKNDAFYHHDVVKDGVVLKQQLGLIPNLSYKIEF